MAPATTGCSLKANTMKPKSQVIREIKSVATFPGKCVLPATAAKNGNIKSSAPATSKTAASAKPKQTQASGVGVKRTHSEMEGGDKGAGKSDLASGHPGEPEKKKIQRKAGVAHQKAIPGSDASKSCPAHPVVGDTNNDDKLFTFHNFSFATLAEFAEWNFRADTKNEVLPPAKEARIVSNLKRQGVKHEDYFNCLAPSSDFFSIVKDAQGYCRGETTMKETALLTFILVDQTKTADGESERYGARAWIEAQRDSGLQVDAALEWKKSPVYAGYRRLLKYFQCCNLGHRAFKAKEAVSILKAARAVARKQHGKGSKNAREPKVLLEAERNRRAKTQRRPLRPRRRQVQTASGE
ncbi:hypothetical protein CPLU01_15396 [Colletotrichum plurivorum]|uniref:Uncharacterized protein n=1 Tax=Colletotrichum plurivorum TaxID=2175906 RepID=A0A8H6MVP1_9PEZI|nr:hypothetical protein CPLU01_15396 [Colletotrichum plurivorum]